MTTTLQSEAPQRARFDGAGLFAIEPKAFGMDHPVVSRTGEPFTRVGTAAVVTIGGPISFGPTCFDSYAEIYGRVSAALASDAEVVVLRVGSPGGDVWGCFDTSRAIRAAAKRSGKRLIAFTESQACSSAYALSSAADLIVASESATVGSIGVIATQAEMSRAEKAMGITFAIAISGARKADGNPHLPFSDDALATMQRDVDASAALFFALVNEHRPQLSLEGIVGLQAGTRLGAEARAAGLVDVVASWSELAAALESPQGVSEWASLGRQAQASEKAMADDKDPKDSDARKALAKAAADGDEKAKRALAAYDEKDEEKAEDEKPEKKDDDSDEKKDAKASAQIGALTAQVQALTSSLAAESAERKRLADEGAAKLAAAARSAFYLTRPDLTVQTKLHLDKLSLEDAKALAETIPVVMNPLAPPNTSPTAGAGADGVNGLSAAQRVAARPNKLMDQVGGLTKYAPAVTLEGNIQSFGALREVK